MTLSISLSPCYWRFLSFIWQKSSWSLNPLWDCRHVKSCGIFELPDRPLSRTLLLTASEPETFTTSVQIWVHFESEISYVCVSITPELTSWAPTVLLTPCSKIYCRLSRVIIRIYQMVRTLNEPGAKWGIVLTSPQEVPEDLLSKLRLCHTDHHPIATPSPPESSQVHSDSGGELGNILASCVQGQSYPHIMISRSC